MLVARDALSRVNVTMCSVSGAHVPALAASLVSIAVCGLLNFVLGDTMEIRR